VPREHETLTPTLSRKAGEGESDPKIPSPIPMGEGEGNLMLCR